MFFGNLKVIFFKISWLDCKQCGENQYKKGMQSTQFSV